MRSLPRFPELFLGVALLSLSPPPAGAELLSNGTFDDDIAGWTNPTPLPLTVTSWSSFDANENPASGSLYVRTNDPEAYLDGPLHCVGTTHGSHVARANAYRELGMKVEPFTMMQLDFFASDDCSGSPLAGSANDVAIGGDDWEPLEFQADAPEGTRSAQLRFLVGGTYDNLADEVYFDDASLLPEPDGAALAATAIGALAMLGRRR